MMHLKKMAALIMALTFSGFFVGTPVQGGGEPVCLYVSSYHAGYYWNDGIERGLISELSGVCRLEKFYMDTKRRIITIVLALLIFAGFVAAAVNYS